MSKVSVIGVGNVGATCANVLAGWNIAKEIVLLDVREGYAEGKAIDIQQSAKIMGINSKITGVTNDYKATAGSDVVVVTSGMPRKPGMSREDLIGTNAKIVSEVVGNIVKFSPNAFIVMVSNPMDTMTYLAYKTCNIKKNHLIGMGGALDSSRFNYYLSKALNAPVCDIDGMVIGAHGDATMVPLMSSVKYKGGDVENAFYAPGACAASIVRAILHDEKRIIPCSVPQNGEYGEEDICLGVPIVVGRKGVEKIVKIKLSEEEKKRFHEGAEKQRNTNKILHDLGLI